MYDSVIRPSLLEASLISGEESTNSGATKSTNWSAKWQGMQTCKLVTEIDTRTLKPGSYPARVIPSTQSSQGSERMDRGQTLQRPVSGSATLVQLEHLLT